MASLRAFVTVGLGAPAGVFVPYQWATRLVKPMIIRYGGLVLNHFMCH